MQEAEGGPQNKTTKQFSTLKQNKLLALRRKKIIKMFVNRGAKIQKEKHTGVV